MSTLSLQHEWADSMLQRMMEEFIQNTIQQLQYLSYKYPCAVVGTRIIRTIRWGQHLQCGLTRVRCVMWQPSSFLRDAHHPSITHDQFFACMFANNVLKWSAAPSACPPRLFIPLSPGPLPQTPSFPQLPFSPPFPPALPSSPPYPPSPPSIPRF